MAITVKINRWQSIAKWSWKLSDYNSDRICSICRLVFDSACPNCKMPGDTCPPVWGKCEHCFHMHCILRWLSEQQQQQEANNNGKCPLCRQVWYFKGENSHNNSNVNTEQKQQQLELDRINISNDSNDNINIYDDELSNFSLIDSDNDINNNDDLILE